jgi:8-oxo-dGTP pyrophosphatase MutT (NUDIX family)
MKPENEITSTVRDRAAVAVISLDDKLLTITRSQSVRAPGQVCFPGGGVEPGETIAEAIVREMQEELNIFVVPIDAVWQSTGASGVELNWWRTEIKRGQIIRPNPDEVHSFQWLTISEIIELPNLLASNLDFFHALQQGEFELPRH